MHSEWKHGQVLRSEKIAGHRFVETVYDPQIKLLPHSHDFVYFCFVVEGDFVESYGRDENLYGQSTLIFHPLHETHSNYFHTKSRCFNIEMSPQHFKRISLNEKLPDDTLIFKGDRINYLSATVYKEFKDFDEYSYLTVEGLMLEILAETFRHQAQYSKADPPRWLLQVKENLDEDFRGSLTIEKLAKSAQVHPTHLVREFRRCYHETIGEYVRKKRIKFACRKLFSSKMPISEIAVNTGFFDQSHFTRTFKKVTGMTPAVFRKTFSSR